MKQITTNELQDLKNKFEFREGTISSHFERSQNKMIYFAPTDYLVFECQNCATPYYYEGKKEPCNNCNFRGDFSKHFDKSDSDEYGIFCRHCGHGFTTWTCESCKKLNSVFGTFIILNKKGGCFIATAVYGSSISDEVLILKEFRDNWLEKYSLGKAFIKFYYLISPPIANLIVKHYYLKAFIKSILIVPLIKIVNNIKRKEK